MACVWTFQAHVYATETETADEALQQIVKATQSADLNSIWRAYEKLFDHPDRHDVDGKLFLFCFRMSDCFHLDTLASVLGKSRNDVRTLIDGFCPHFASWKEYVRTSASYKDMGDEEFEDAFFSAKAGLHRFTGHDKSCEDWAHRIELSVPEERVERAVNPVIWPLMRVGLHDAKLLDTDQVPSSVATASPDQVWWPVISYRIAKSHRKAIIDTGTSTIALQHDEDFPKGQFVYTHDDVVAVGLEGKLYRVKKGILQELNRGGESFRDLLANSLSPEVFVNRQQVGDLDILGMSFLMMYDSVCFAWQERRLYLGQLGPCENGLEVPAALSGAGELYVQIRTKYEDRQWSAFFDTGAEKSHCSPELFTDDTEFVFHISLEHDLNGTCLLAEELRKDEEELEYESLQAGLIGLDTLQQFTAWGWQRGPLLTYFVPNGDKPSSN